MPKTMRSSLAILLAAAALFTACSGDDERGADSGPENSVDDELPATGTAVGERDQGTSETDENDGPDGTAGGGTVGTTGGPDDDLVVSEGGCTVADLHRQQVHIVDNIPVDDPDGGLNLRSSPGDGDVTATLPAGTFVMVNACARSADGGRWFYALTPDDDGWANAAFLSDELPVADPSAGGTDLEAEVVALIEALATEDWAGAAASQERPDFDQSFYLAQLATDDGLTLAQAFEQHCAARVCDAPYEVVDVRGSHIPELVSPEVDVQFTYPLGVVIQTYRRFPVDDGFALDVVPGRSVLSRSSDLVPTSDLVTAPDPADQGLYEAAEQVRQALLSEQGPRIPDPYLPDEGIAVSTDAYIDPDVAERIIVTGDDLTSGIDQRRFWGYASGVGAPLVDTVDWFMDRYRFSMALLAPDVVVIDERIGISTTIANLSEVFPDARIVEFHRQGRAEFASFNWSSVRMAFEERNGQWTLIALTSDEWSP